MKWNVYVSSFNDRKIEVRNVFELSSRFDDSLKRIRYNKKKQKYPFLNEEFKNDLKIALQSAYWSKCEYEICLTDLFQVIEAAQLEKMKEKRRFYTVDVVGSRKIDVYEQVMLNWDLFVEYVWNNL